MMNNYKARARSQSIIVKVKESRVHYITYQTLTLMELSQCQTVKNTDIKYHKDVYGVTREEGSSR
jgi:hypothetical protein